MLQKIKYSTKVIIAYSLYFSGLLALLKRYRLNNKVVVLMYHRILPKDKLGNCFSTTGIIVSPHTFESHIKYLTEHFNFLSINNFSEYLSSNKLLSGYNCIITFDDGWHDNYTNALPILKKYNANAVVFLPTDYIDNEIVFWQENLSCLIHNLLLKNKKHTTIIRKYNLGALIDSKHESQKFKISTYIRKLKNKPYNFINKMILDLNKTMNVPDNFSHHASIDHYLTWDQVKIMSSAGITFGSHAISHRILPKLSDNDINNELSQSKEILNSKIGTTVDSIAYPNGNYNNVVIETTKHNGYIMGFSTDPGYYSQGDNPFCIKRINIHDDATRNIPMLLCRILEIF